MGQIFHGRFHDSSECQSATRRFRPLCRARVLVVVRQCVVR